VPIFPDNICWFCGFFEPEWLAHEAPIRVVKDETRFVFFDIACSFITFLSLKGDKGRQRSDQFLKVLRLHFVNLCLKLLGFVKVRIQKSLASFLEQVYDFMIIEGKGDVGNSPRLIGIKDMRFIFDQGLKLFLQIKFKGGHFIVGHPCMVRMREFIPNLRMYNELDSEVWGSDRVDIPDFKVRGGGVAEIADKEQVDHAHKDAHTDNHQPLVPLIVQVSHILSAEKLPVDPTIRNDALPLSIIIVDIVLSVERLIASLFVLAVVVEIVKEGSVHELLAVGEEFLAIILGTVLVQRDPTEVLPDQLTHRYDSITVHLSHSGLSHARKRLRSIH